MSLERRDSHPFQNFHTFEVDNSEQYRLVKPSTCLSSLMFKQHVFPFRSKLFYFLLLPLCIIVPSLFLLQYVYSSSPFVKSRWIHQYRPSVPPLLSSFGPKKCHFVALIITSDDDYNNGTIDTWFRTLPPNQTNHVCCVSVRRSLDTAFRLEPHFNSCDVLYVPMVRFDEYLTISEKVRLAFGQITKYYVFDWLLKTDVDSFVCFSRILTLLQNYDPNGVVQLGYAESRNILLEDPRHYWYDPSMTDIVHNPRQTVVPGTGLYHPYMQGAGYILSYGALTRVQALLPSLRYSPMEDAMVGSWLLSLNAHHVVLDLDLHGQRRVCNLPPYLYISHNRKGSTALENCHIRHVDCAAVPIGEVPIVQDVTFLVTTHMEQRYKQVMDLYHSIRAAFPRNHVHFADVSESKDVLHRLLKTVNDPYVHGISMPNESIASTRNRLVLEARTAYVCLLQDEQRMSWETMIARMIRVVQNNEADIATGFLKFNPNMNNSATGLYANGFSVQERQGEVWKHWVTFDFQLPNVSMSVNGTSGFILTRPKTLLENPWRDFGPFTDDEWHIRLSKSAIRIALVNSGVRHGYHYELYNQVKNDIETKVYASQTCDTFLSLGVVKVGGLNRTLDCQKRTFRSDNSTFIKW